MPTKVTVNAGQIAINDGSSFLVTACDGSINDQHAQGFFVRDTRLISYYEISINRHPLQLRAKKRVCDIIYISTTAHQLRVKVRRIAGASIV